MPSEHSQWSASQFARTMRCPGSTAIQQLAAEGAIELPWVERPAGKYAAEGTAAHEVLEYALGNGMAAAWDKYHDQAIEVDGFAIVVDDDMLSFVGRSYDNVMRLADGHAVMAEQRVDYSDAIGVEGGTGWGTSDVIVARGTDLLVYDFKYGRGLKVEAAMNPQLLCYASGALALYDGILADFETVTVVIDQPRLGHLDEHTYKVSELWQWQEGPATEAVRRVLAAKGDYDGIDDKGWAALYLHATDEECPFCPATPYHPLMPDVPNAPGKDRPADPSEFGDAGATWLAEAMAKVAAVEAWAKAVRDEIDARLHKGLPVPGFKLVAGRLGNRKWTDDEEAEAILRRTNLKLDELAPRKVVSPTTAEKLMKADRIGPRHWAQLEKAITRSAGKAIVVPSDDPRPEWTEDATEDFDLI